MIIYNSKSTMSRCACRVQPSATQRTSLVATFIDECTDRSDSLSTRSSDLYESFILWCQRREKPSLTHAAFGRALTALGYKREQTRTSIYIVGIALRTRV